eukprot:TRINITY_DN49033_c0_g1_i1.p1 TRINITY_DN49033_c0_g1~~TRINITY_DN49033_c0_g1_i1.p1  ORF type:complete len:665 (+),score=100.83 TRINITY_DN49033_c0_g1_i1:37-2031(+)
MAALGSVALSPRIAPAVPAFACGALSPPGPHGPCPPQPQRVERMVSMPARSAPSACSPGSSYVAAPRSPHVPLRDMREGGVAMPVPGQSARQQQPVLGHRTSPTQPQLVIPCMQLPPPCSPAVAVSGVWPPSLSAAARSRLAQPMTPREGVPQPCSSTDVARAPQAVATVQPVPRLRVGSIAVPDVLSASRRGAGTPTSQRCAGQAVSPIASPRNAGSSKAPQAAVPPVNSSLNSPRGEGSVAESITSARNQLPQAQQVRRPMWEQHRIQAMKQMQQRRPENPPEQAQHPEQCVPLPAQQLNHQLQAQGQHLPQAHSQSQLQPQTQFQFQSQPQLQPQQLQVQQQQHQPQGQTQQHTNSPSYPLSLPLSLTVQSAFPQPQILSQKASDPQRQPKQTLEIGSHTDAAPLVTPRGLKSPKQPTSPGSAEMKGHAAQSLLHSPMFSNSSCDSPRDQRRVLAQGFAMGSAAHLGLNGEVDSPVSHDGEANGAGVGDVHLLQRISQLEAQVVDRNSLVSKINKQQVQLDRLQALAEENAALKAQLSRRPMGPCKEASHGGPLSRRNEPRRPQGSAAAGLPRPSAVADSPPPTLQPRRFASSPLAASGMSQNDAPAVLTTASASNLGPGQRQRTTEEAFAPPPRRNTSPRPQNVEIVEMQLAELEQALGL